MNGSTTVSFGERVRTGEVVVDVRHRPVVTDLLRDGGFAEVEVEDLPDLGLALLTVRDLGQTVESLPDRDGLLTDLIAEREKLRLPDRPTDLDVLMLYLRRTSSRKHAGWTPFMGKNRELEPLEGFPHIGGGEGFPQRPPTGQVFTLEDRPSARGRAPRVGVLDTRLAPNHTLNGRYVTADFIKDVQPFSPWEGHATFVAGMILERALGAELDVRRVLHDEDGRATSWEVAKAMASFLRSGIEVLNLSFGGPTADGMPPLVLERAVDVLSADMVLVAAAGNHGDQPEDVGAALHQDITTVPRSRNSPIWPAAMPNVVAVGATDTEDGIASFTPPDVPWLDLVAPGKDVESTFLTGRVEAVTVEVENGEVLGIVKKDLGDFEGTARWSGTSFAAAGATGEIARLMQTHQLTAQAAVAEIREREGGRGTVHGLRQG